MVWIKKSQRGNRKPQSGETDKTQTLQTSYIFLSSIDFHSVLKMFNKTWTIRLHQTHENSIPQKRTIRLTVFFPNLAELSRESVSEWLRVRALDSGLADRGLDSHFLTGTEPWDQESVTQGTGSKIQHYKKELSYIHGHFSYCFNYVLKFAYFFPVTTQKVFDCKLFPRFHLLNYTLHITQSLTSRKMYLLLPATWRH